MTGAKNPLGRTLITEGTPERFGSPDDERQGTLTVLVGPNVGATFALVRDVTVIGRNLEAQVPIEDDGVSREHARIERSGGEYFLQDLGSTNGTYLGDQRLGSRTLLVDGARILIGNTLLRFALLDAIEQQASKQVYEQGIHDGLTRISNRRYLDERLVSEFAFAVRHGAALCVLLVDIDHFKRVNDTFGHAAGDFVLKRVAGELRSAARAEDLVARYGGEEFAVIARGIDVAGARAFAERVRSTIERTVVMWGEERLHVSASIGVAHNHTGSPVKQPEGLLAAADRALYAAKQKGRNRVEVAASQTGYSNVHQDPSELLPRRR
jgi:diguanylate cyclase (GGDEF)-like protein